MLKDLIEKREGLVTRMRDADKADDNAAFKTAEDELRSYVDKATTADVLALLLDLASRQQWRGSGSRDQARKDIAKLLGVDLAAIARQVRADAKKLEKPKTGAKKGARKKASASRKPAKRPKAAPQRKKAARK